MGHKRVVQGEVWDGGGGGKGDLGAVRVVKGGLGSGIGKRILQFSGLRIDTRARCP